MYDKIYKNSLVVKNTLGPYIWAIESLDNYIWTCKLGLALIDEYKFRYNKDTFKSQIIIETLLDNPPNLPKIGKTKFISTNQFDMFQFISNDPVICARYNYCEMKCSNDIWTNREKPDSLMSSNIEYQISMFLFWKHKVNLLSFLSTCSILVFAILQ